jgi:hypothetical protein
MNTDKADTNPNAVLANLQPKYCSYCGEELDKCSCCGKTVTITFNLNQEIFKTLSSLTSLIPKIQISSDTCKK